MTLDWTMPQYLCPLSEILRMLFPVYCYLYYSYHLTGCEQFKLKINCLLTKCTFLLHFNNACMRSYQFQPCLTVCNPMDCSPSGSSVHGNFPGKNNGVDCQVLLQGPFLTQELKYFNSKKMIVMLQQQLIAILHCILGQIGINDL